MRSFTGCVCLVTGGANGMGRAFVTALARDGARVATCDVDEPGLAILRAELPEDRSLVLRTELRDPVERERFVTRARDRLGPIDLLVNNAGVGVGGPFADTAGDDWAWIREINLDAPLDLMRLVIPEMKARGRGRILNVASVAGLAAQPYIATYAATKHALVGLSRSVDEELRPYGVTITVACPGLVRTGIVGRGRLRNLDVRGMMPLFRFGIEADVAARRMLVAARRGRRIVIPNHDMKLLHVLYRVAPRAWDALVGRIAFRAYRAQDRAQERASTDPAAP